VLGGTLALAAQRASAAEVERPTIDSVSVATVYEHEATLEAQVDPQGSETAYEFLLECQGALPCPSVTTGQRGHIAAGFTASRVSAHLTGLVEGASYRFGVIATNSAGSSESRGYILDVPVTPPGACPNGCGTNEQYGSEVPGWYVNLSNSESEQTVKAYEAKVAKEREAKEHAEQEAQHTREQEEAQATEAAAKVAQAAALRQREEEAMAVGVVSLASAKIMVKDGRVSLVKLECRGTAICRGKLMLVSRATHSKAGTRARTAKIGTANFSIPTDTTGSVTLDLDAAGRALLRAARGHLTAALTIDELPVSADSTLTETVQLAYQRPRAVSKTKA
jgi:hypothetical protein